MSKELAKEIKKVSKSKVKKEKLIEITTGVTLLDLVLGKLSTGMINIVGDSGTAKSILCGEIIAHNYHYFKKNKINFDWFYDDPERGYKVDSKKRYGFDIKKDGFFKKEKALPSKTLEDFLDKIYTILEKKEPETRFIYIVDSFDKITSEDEVAFVNKRIKSLKKKKAGNTEKEEKESGSYNLAKQKGGHQFFRVLLDELIKNNIYLFFISQTKKKIGITFGNPSYRTGGDSLDFYPDTVFWLAKAGRYIKKERAVGTCIKAKGTKVRNPYPFRECFFDLLFDYGIDNVSSNIKFLYDLKTDGGKDKKKEDAAYTIINEEGKKEKIKGLLWSTHQNVFDIPQDEIKKEIDRNNIAEFSSVEKLVKHIEENDLEDELAEKVKEKWQVIEESISSKDRKNKWE